MIVLDHLVGITKMSLRKSIGRVSVTSSQLQTILTEVEVVVNTRPLLYVDNELDNKIITPAHFLSRNIKTGTPVLTVKNDDEKTDPNYHVEKMTAREKNLKTMN